MRAFARVASITLSLTLVFSPLVAAAQTTVAPKPVVGPIPSYYYDQNITGVNPADQLNALYLSYAKPTATTPAPTTQTSSFWSSILNPAPSPYPYTPQSPDLGGYQNSYTSTNNAA